MSGVFWGETFKNFKLLPQVWQRSHYPNLVLTGFPSDLCERDETEARLRLITLIEMNQICPFFLLKMVTNMKSYKSELHTVTGEHAA